MHLEKAHRFFSHLDSEEGTLLSGVVRYKLGQQLHACSFKLYKFKRRSQKLHNTHFSRYEIRKQTNADSTFWGDIPWGLKLKRGGKGRPLGRRVLGSRSSSKNGCTIASIYNQQSYIKHSEINQNGYENNKKQ